VKSKRQIIFYKTYFPEFYVQQNEKVQDKIDYVFKVIQNVQNVPKKFLEHLTGTEGIYEIRIEFESNIYRIFSCFDKGNLIVLFNAFQKKTQKTPKNEIELAIKLKNEYFQSKTN
jgi:phage-related protein